MIDDSGPIPPLRPLEYIPYQQQDSVMIAIRDPMKLSPIIIISPSAHAILRLIDGKRTVLDIQAEFMRRHGELLYSHLIRDLINRLNEYHLFANEDFREFYIALKAEFAGAGVHESVLAGESYPDDPEQLATMLVELTGIPAAANGGSSGATASGLRGLVVPHIDFQRGGAVYGKGYELLLQVPRPDTIVILGIDHLGSPGPVILSRKSFQTPLGLVTADQSLLGLLTEACGNQLYTDEFAHRSEHSVEFQVLMLQHIFGQAVPQIVPVLVSNLRSKSDPGGDPLIQSFTGCLRNAMHRMGDKLLIIASVDLSHVGTQFGGPALDKHELHGIGEYDAGILRQVVALDSRKLAELIHEDPRPHNVCGYPALFVLTLLMEGMRGETVQYRQWFDEPGGSCVTFAAVGFFDRAS
ncbi:AmmeMemoRadiSam system protein B, partial [bacterium]|nr:AmmeMemoRadiSam system protein B [candidate division CSSED10-310 bacterium]